MALSPKQKKTYLIVGLVLLAILVLYFWYTRYGPGSANSPQGNAAAPDTGLGSNLNSVAPELAAGSTGPNSGLNYYAGSTTVELGGGSPGSSSSNSTEVGGGTHTPPPHKCPRGHHWDAKKGKCVPDVRHRVRAGVQLPGAR